MTDEFTDGYIECGLWASLDLSRDVGSGNNPPTDENYGREDIPADVEGQLAEDCRDFQEANRDDLGMVYARLDGYSPASAGHDFWLTRNRHGAGFWDRFDGGDGELRAALTRLSDASHAYGEINLSGNGETVEIF